MKQNSLLKCSEDMNAVSVSWLMESGVCGGDTGTLSGEVEEADSSMHSSMIILFEVAHSPDKSG